MKEADVKELAGRYPRFIRWSNEDSCFIGSLPDLDGDCTHGDTPEEVAERLNECAEIYVADCLDDGTPLPEPSAFVVAPSQYRVPKSGNAIGTLRARFGLSQKDFAALLGVGLSTLVKWENGIRRPSGAAARLLQIAEKYPETVLGYARATGE